ncbi:MAG: hypothetical protein OYI31_08880 [Chloroflexota bacterium]|nr:hypothetical protein [Chloroflexota bacterium]MDE2941453.1 hypothetical protein [Chloroflexota bacterium]MDE3268546.1 hypothetical protein [Chloroflexota bacterium]
MPHAHMHSYTSLRAGEPEQLTDDEAFNSILDSIITQELVLGRSVEWTGNIGEVWQDPSGNWTLYTRAIALTGNGDDGTPCIQRDTLICEEIRAEQDPPIRH